MTHAQDCNGDCTWYLLITPAFPQKAEIEAVNAKWVGAGLRGPLASPPKD
jgi:hypothetical protein